MLRLALFELGDVIEVVLKVQAGEEKGEGGAEIKAHGLAMVVVIFKLAADHKDDGHGEDVRGQNERANEPDDGRLGTEDELSERKLESVGGKLDGDAGKCPGEAACVRVKAANPKAEIDEPGVEEECLDEAGKQRGQEGFNEEFGEQGGDEKDGPVDARRRGIGGDRLVRLVGDELSGEVVHG